MQRAASDVMQSIIFSAVLDALAALKRASGGLPNQLLRDVQAIHILLFAGIAQFGKAGIGETWPVSIIIMAAPPFRAPSVHPHGARGNNDLRRKPGCLPRPTRR